jgi:penicillin-insensitive murein endopeptidase
MLLRWLSIALALMVVPAAVHAKPPRASTARTAEPHKRAPRRGPTASPPRPAPPRPDSVGRPNEGKLIAGARLDTSKPYLRVVPLYAKNDVRWGLPSLVAMIDRAARGVAKRYPGSVLEVGDLSRKGGGEVDRHHSHESGRDVDLGFYVVDKRGRGVRASRFQQIDASLRSTTVRGGRFDVPRNWALIELMLTDPQARVSHILIAEHLRQALLSYARPRVSQALYRRAAIALLQPTQPLPHDDHMHVRISCPRDARDHCVELSKNAPIGKAKVAKRIARDRKKTVRTPPRSPAAPTHARRTQAGDAEAHADAAEVRDALDETGLLRITE